MVERGEAIKGNTVMGMEMLLKFTLMPSTMLASIISSSTNFITEMSPLRTPVIRHPTSPLWMLIASVFLTAKYIVALLRTKMMLMVSSKFAICEPYRFITGIAWHYRESRVIGSYPLAMSGFKISNITSKRTPLSNFGLSTISNKFFPADFAYQLSHNYIISQYLSFKKGADYRRLKGGV